MQRLRGVLQYRDLMTRTFLVWREICPKADDSYYKDGGVIVDIVKEGRSKVDPGTAYGNCI